MNKESIQKEIDHEINIKNNLWNAFMVSAGGTISLIVNAPYNFIRISFILVGFVVALILLNGYFNKVELIEDKLKKLKGN